MTRPLGEFAELVDGKLIGDFDREISRAETIACSTSKSITFAISQLHLESFFASEAPAAIVSEQVDLASLPENKSVIVVSNVESSFTKIVSHFRPPIVRPKIGISPAAIISPTAKIADDVDIYPGAFIGEGVEIGCGSVVFPNVTILEQCTIGANVTIHPGVTLYENSVIGDRVILQAGAVIGANGFGYKTSGGRHQLSAQLGNVILKNDVEIGANATVDRGTYGSTVVAEGSKIDNLVMIAHNCEIGKHNLICSQVAVAGSSTTGDYVVMGGQVGVGDHLSVGDGARLLAKSGVMQNVPAKANVLGIPARPARQQLKIHAAVARMPEMRKQVKALLARIEQLENAQANDRTQSDDQIQVVAPDNKASKDAA